MNNVFMSYETGLSLLLKRLGHSHPRYAEALTLQARLLENLARTRLYGDTDTNRAERVQVMDALNRLATESLGKNFNTLLQESATLKGSGAIAQGTEATAAGAGGVAVGGDVYGSVIITGNGNAVGVEYRQREVEKARQAGDRMAEEAALGNLGSAYAAQGNFRHAVEYYEQALAIARELGERQTEAIYLQNMGLVLLHLAEIESGRHQAHLSGAADALRQAMELFDALGVTPLLRARTRYHLGRCYHRLGRWRDAIILLEQAREAFSRYKARPELAHTLLELGQLYHVTHDPESALIYLKDALRLFRRIEDTDGIAVTQEALGNLALQTARPSEAIASLHEARESYATLRRSERVRVVDDLLRIAHQAYQPAGGGKTTP
jgi:tetratricopeptide (TPR) repeat protein